jgi:hypothetical protein
MTVQQAPRSQAVRRLQAIEAQAERLRNWLERHPRWPVAGIALVYLVWTAVLASHKLMWNDELYTYYIATQPSLRDIWQALMTGAEQIPPTFHLLTRGVLRALGPGPISIRLPEMLGFLLMILCLFRFIARRTSAFYGLIAMLFPLVTDAYRYAYEARPYGLVLGLSGLALVSWQGATEGRNRWLWLTLLSASLAAAVASHYYGVLVVGALAVGEVVRTRSRGRVDLPIWIALVLACAVPLLAFSPLILRSRGYADTFWSGVKVTQLPLFYLGVLGPARKAVAAAVLAAMIYAMFVPGASDREPRSGLPRHELAAAFGFALIPVLAYALGVLVTHTFVNRYALPAVLGLALLAAYGVYALPRARTVVGTALLVAMAGSFVLSQYGDLRTTIEEANFRLAASDLLQKQAEPTLPIVASEPHVFMALAHYAPSAVTDRLVYLGDVEASLRHLGHNSVERGMLDLVGPWFRLPVEAFEPYIASHPRFWVYGNLGWLTWITDELRADGWRIELQDRLGGEYLLLVTRPDEGAPTSGADASSIP